MGTLAWIPASFRLPAAAGWNNDAALMKTGTGMTHHPHQLPARREPAAAAQGRRAAFGIGRAAR